MFTMLESNFGYGASYTSASCRGAERDLLNQQLPAPLSYSQMLRMSLEESTEDMGSSHDSVWRSNGVYTASEEAYMGSGSEYVLRNEARSEDQMEGNEGARSMKGYSHIGASSLSMKGASHMNVCVRQEEGFAENDYGFTCLRLGRGTPPCDRFDVPSASPLNVSRNTSGFTRTCKLCGTSKTPLWRSGPMGAKSLCNACGIRSNKAKKLSAANEEDEQGAGSRSSQSKGFLKQAASSKVTKRNKSELEAKMMKKKTHADAEESDGELTKEENQKNKKQKRSGLTLKQQQAKLPRLLVNVSVNSTSPVKTESSSCVTSRGTPSPCSTQRKPFPPISMLSTQVPHACLNFDSMCHFDDSAFPKDEEQAAFLLMALSCGLVLA